MARQIGLEIKKCLLEKEKEVKDEVTDEEVKDEEKEVKGEKEEVKDGKDEAKVKDEVKMECGEGSSRS